MIVSRTGRLTAAVARGLAAGVLAAGGVVACGSSRAQVASFDDQGAKPVSCMVHQASEPSGRYQPGPNADTASVFQVLRYYTMNGGHPYCDGRRSTTTDLAWLHLYVAAGADPSHVARNLNATTTP